MQFSCTKDNMQRERISGVSICLRCHSIHTKLGWDPAHKFPTMTEAFLFTRSMEKSLECCWLSSSHNTAFIRISVKSINTSIKKLSQVCHSSRLHRTNQLHWRHGDTPANSNVYVFQEFHILPSRFRRNVERCIYKGNCVVSKCGFYSSTMARTNTGAGTKNRRGYRGWSSNCDKPGTNTAPSHLSHTHTAALAEWRGNKRVFKDVESQ